MTSARSSFAQETHGPRTWPLTRRARTVVFAAMRGSLVLDLLAALVPVDLVLAAEVAVRAHVVEDRVVPVGVLDEVDLLRAALRARLALLPEPPAVEHRRQS